MASGELDRRRSVLGAALGFALLDPCEPELRLLHHWLEGVVSILVVLVLVLAAQVTQSPTLVMLKNIAVILCILVAIVWLGRAVVRGARR